MLAFTYSIFAALCGWLEAILYDKRGAEAFKSNEHVGMTLQRIAAALSCVASVVLYRLTGQFWILLELIPAALFFPLVHDESYNFTRLWLSFSGVGPQYLNSDKSAFVLAWHEYKYGYQSPTTTARNDFNGRSRTLLAIAGLLLLVGLNLLYFWA